MSPKVPVIHTNLRLPQELYEQIKALAERDGISINAAMIILLRAGIYEHGRRFSPPPPDSSEA